MNLHNTTDIYILVIFMFSLFQVDVESMFCGELRKVKESYLPLALDIVIFCETN